VLSVVPKQAQDAVAAIVRTIFAQPDHASAMTQLHEVARMLGPKFPQVAALLEDAAEDVLAHQHFPREHRRRLHSTDERVKDLAASSGFLPCGVGSVPGVVDPGAKSRVLGLQALPRSFAL